MQLVPPNSALSVPKTRGYGPDDASFAAIVLEATAVAFTMLISHLGDPQSDFRSYLRRYDGAFRPVETLVNGIPSCNTPS